MPAPPPVLEQVRSLPHHVELVAKNLYLNKGLMPRQIAAQLGLEKDFVRRLITRRKWAAIRRNAAAALEARSAKQAEIRTTALVAEVAELSEQVWREGMQSAARAARAAGESIAAGDAGGSRDYASAYRSLAAGAGGMVGAWREARGLSVRGGEERSGEVALSLTLLSLPAGQVRRELSAGSSQRSAVSDQGAGAGSPAQAACAELLPPGAPAGS